ncbi:MAG: GNAT family N-acetyltransferase [Marmoricola sp.]|nr:GNAT family N-acetyltransferase [Marmoricola sp.]
MSDDVEVRDLQDGDREAWRRLFAGYREFYECEPSEQVLDSVWGWLHDPDHELGGLVALVDGRVVGIAHHRSYVRPSEAETGLFLDDLFTDAEVRGRGVGRALIARLAEIARERGAAKVRWVTAADNHTAQRLYDQVATRTSWLTYDLIL